MFNDCQPAGDLLLILVDLRMWYRKSVVPSTGGGSSEIKIDEKNAKNRLIFLFGFICQREDILTHKHNNS